MSEETTTTTRHFSVTGEAITQIARDMLLSEMPGKAWRLLAQNLLGGKPGQAETIASAVLDGKKKLVGDSSAGIDVRKERGAKSYLKQLHYIYAGRIRVNGRWYRPEAQVMSFNERDAAYATDKMGECPSKLSHRFERWARYRVEFYGNGRGVALDVSKTKPMKPSRTKMRKIDAEVDVVLFRECSEPPHWWPEPSTPFEAYEQFIAAGCRLNRIDPMDGVKVDAEVEPFDDRRAERESKEELEAEMELQEEEDRRRAEQKLATYREYGEKVRAQANGDFVEIKLPDGYVPTMAENEPSKMFANGIIRVPRLPFECWCLWRTHLSHLRPDWECVSPSGLKMQMDDPYHTDWMLGADVHLRHSYEGHLKSASLDMMGEVQRKYGKFEHTVLVGGPDVEGIVGKPKNIGAIMVLRDLRNTPENNDAVANARAIITENGGELAHVATLARENKIPVFRVPDAIKHFPVGMRLWLYPDRGKIHSGSFDMAFLSESD